jgi:hypothetical protein
MQRAGGENERRDDGDNPGSNDTPRAGRAGTSESLREPGSCLSTLGMLHLRLPIDVAVVRPRVATGAARKWYQRLDR